MIRTITTMTYANGVATVTSTAPQPGSGAQARGGCTGCAKGKSAAKAPTKQDKDDYLKAIEQQEQ